MDPGTLTKVLHDFFTTEEGELSLNKGDFFLIYKIIDKHWCHGQSHNRVGKFPVNHLHKVEVPEISGNESLFISIAPFRGEQPGDLSFNQGEIIVGTAEASSGWFTGYIGPRKGIFPVSYVWQLDLSLVKEPLQKKLVKRKAKVKTNLKAQLDEELDLVEGEIVTVTEILDDGWCRGYKENGKQGTFPESFVTYQEDQNTDEVDEGLPNFSSIENTFPSSAVTGKIYKDFGESYSNTNQPLYDDPAPNYDDLFPDTAVSKIQVSSDYNPLGLKPYAITLYPFNAQFPNELSFEAGQVIELIKYIDTEWAEGAIDNVKGIFPVAYVNVIVDCTEIQKDIEHSDTSKIQNDLKPDDQVKVEYKFDAQMSGDLNISEGEVVTVVELTNDDWVTVRNDRGEIGLCPRSYVTMDYESSNEVFHDALDEFVVHRNNKADSAEREVNKTKRLSEPHRPAPPAPTPGRVPLQKQTNQVESTNNENNNSSSIKQEKARQRQNVISELYITEKDYVRDLKMTYEVFNLHNPSFLESKGIDVTILFGNIKEIIEISEELLELILRAMKGCDEDYQAIGPCFLQLSEKMRNAYRKYCSNYELSANLLQKYEDNKEIMKIFDKGVETLRTQVACFDMKSVLIKPVQRILKYPLILNQLLKNTEDDHPDKPKIEEASEVMRVVASYINEYKRKKELAFKYLHSNNTLIGKMANLNIHSVAKKSSRLSAKVSVTLGLTNLPTDSKFDELEKDFLSLEKSTRQFIKDVEQCVQKIDEETRCGEVLIEEMHQYFIGVPNEEIRRLREIRNIVRSQFRIDFKNCIEKRVMAPLNALMAYLAGPALLIKKRLDKMLDYDTAISRNEKFKEKGIIPEDLSSAKNNFEALNQQLIEELPIFIQAATEILYNCIGAFTNARKLYNGKIMKKYLAISESANQISMNDILDSFLVYHNLLYNQISRLSYGGTNTRVDESTIDYCLQSEIHRKTLREKYPPNMLYVVTQSVSNENSPDLSATKGTIVGVIKMNHPSGDKSKWFVDNGSMKGFIERQYLQPSEEAKLIEKTANEVCTGTSVDLMSLDSPVKETKRCSADLQSLYSNTSDEQEFPPNYENIANISESICEFVYGLCDFHEPTYPGTLSIKEGQALKVLKKHDEKNNPEWWLVEERSGGKGYVPFNCLKQV